MYVSPATVRNRTPVRSRTNRELKIIRFPAYFKAELKMLGAHLELPFCGERVLLLNLLNENLVNHFLFVILHQI